MEAYSSTLCLLTDSSVRIMLFYPILSLYPGLYIFKIVRNQKFTDTLIYIQVGWKAAPQKGDINQFWFGPQVFGPAGPERTLPSPRREDQGEPGDGWPEPGGGRLPDPVLQGSVVRPLSLYLCTTDPDPGSVKGITRIRTLLGNLGSC